MSDPTYLLGNVIKSTWTCTPATGTVDSADVSCFVEKGDGTYTEVTGDVQEDATNVFSVSVVTTEADAPGNWIFHWESVDPSPIILSEETFIMQRPKVVHS